MLYSLKLLALVALLFLGSWGWGSAGVSALRRAGWQSVRDEIGPPLQVLLGIGIFFAVGGSLVAVTKARVGILVAWHVIGVVLLVTRLAIARRRDSGVTRPTPGTLLGVAGVSGFLVVMALGLAIGNPLFNLDDDDAAYIYLAKRLSSTGGLIDPFNLRRLTDYGGSTLFHSIFLGVSGASSLRAFEVLFAALLLVLVAVRTTRRRWIVAGSLLLGIGVILGHGLGGIANLSPNYSIAAFSLGTLQLLRRIRPASRRDQPLLYVVIGVFLAAVLALRFSFVLSLVVAVPIALFLMRGRRCVKGLLIICAVTLLCTTGWAVALFRSSRTPLFPLTNGNYSPSWPTGQDPRVFAHGFDRFARFAWHVFAGAGTGWVAVAAVMVATAFLIKGYPDQRGMLVLLAAGVGCLAQIAIYVYGFSGSNYSDVLRLVGPSTLACGLLGLDVLWPAHGAHGEARSTAMAVDSETPPPVRPDPRPGRGTALRLLALPMTIVLLLGGAALTVGYSVTGFVHNSRVYLTLGSNVLVGAYDIVDRDAPFKAEYGRLNAMIPRGAKVLAAVDHPDLLNFSKYDFATLDVVGAASPPPHMPYFQGPQAKVDYLRRLGYRYIVSEAPSVRGLYNLQSWYADLHDDIYAYRAWPPYFVDWQDTVQTLERDGRFQVRYSGSLALIRLE